MKPQFVLPIRIDKNQIFTDLFVCVSNKFAPIDFKVDTECNSVLLNHDAIMILTGINCPKALKAKLNTLPNTKARVGDGRDATYKELGLITLRVGTKDICNIPAICHPTATTNNLLGTSVLNLFNRYTFQVKGDFTFLELH